MLEKKKKKEYKPFTSIFSPSTPQRRIYVHFVENWICSSEKSCLQGISYARLSVFFVFYPTSRFVSCGLASFFFFFHLVLVLRPYDASRMKRLCDLIVSEVPVNESDDEYPGNGYSNSTSKRKILSTCVRVCVFIRKKNCEKETRKNEYRSSSK